MQLKRPLTFLIVVFTMTGLAAGSYWASLLISLQRLEAGIRERNVAKLEKSINWSAVRDQLRLEVRGTTLRRFYQDALGKQETSGHILGTLLAGTIAPAMLDQFVDGFVTPQGLVDLLGKDPDHKGGGIAISRTGFTDFDEYTIEAGKPATNPAKTVRAVLRREGITWRVVRVGFPPGEAPWETAETTSVGLKIQKLAPARTPFGLMIEGDVLNTGATAREVPQLRVALRNAAEKELQFKVINPPIANLAPGEAAHFKTPFEGPDDAATGVVVTFAPHVSSDNTSMAGGRPADPAPPPSAAPSKPEERNPISKTEAPQQLEKTPRATEENAKPEPAPQIAKQDVKSEDRKYDPRQFGALVRGLAPVHTRTSGDAAPQPPRVASAHPSLQPTVPLAGQLRASELDMIRDQIARCWSVPAGARDAKDLVIEIKVVADPDGTVRQATIVDQGRLGSDPFFRAAAESARRAFFNPQCRPLQLPIEKYAIWKNFVIDLSLRHSS
jgi:hypothetical protein